MGNLENSLVIGATEAYESEVLNEGVEPARAESMSQGDWCLDAGDYLTNLNTEDMAKLREGLRFLMWWDEYMIRGTEGHDRLRYSGNVANRSMDIAALLLKSLEASGIKRQQLEVEE